MTAKSGSSPFPEYAPRLRSAILKEGTRPATAHLSLAKSLFQAGRHDQALVEVEAALRENPELAPGHFIKGLILARRAEYATAAGCLEYAARLDDQEVGHWLALAYVRQELGLQEQALIAVDRAVRLDPQQANAHLMRGDILADLKRDHEAMEAYRSAARCNPQLMKARYRLGHLLLQAGETEQAVRQLILAQRLNPTDPNTRLSLGNMLRKLGRPEEALQEYRAAAELFSGEPQALPHAMIGETYLEQGLTVEAINAFRTALKIDGKQVNCYLHLGRIFMGQGKYAEAVELFQAAVEADPRLPEAREWLEQARLAAGAAQEPAKQGAATHHENPAGKVEETSGPALRS